MNLLGDAIGLQQEKLVFSWRMKGGAIVTGAEGLIFRNGNQPEKLMKKSILGAGFHWRRLGQ
jgi:hypothetical protein